MSYPGDGASVPLNSREQAAGNKEPHPVRRDRGVLSSTSSLVLHWLRVALGVLVALCVQAMFLGGQVGS